jgi:hypothetical protein
MRGRDLGIVRDIIIIIIEYTVKKTKAKVPVAITHMHSISQLYPLH